MICLHPWPKRLAAGAFESLGTECDQRPFLTGLGSVPATCPIHACELAKAPSGPFDSGNDGIKATQLNRRNQFRSPPEVISGQAGQTAVGGDWAPENAPWPQNAKR